MVNVLDFGLLGFLVDLGVAAALSETLCPGTRTE
jgi:hypothetical protein